MFTAAHQHLSAPLILIWDNLNTHISAGCWRCPDGGKRLPRPKPTTPVRPTDPPQVRGATHRKPTDITKLSGTRRNGRYDGYKTCLPAVTRWSWACKRS